MPAARIREAVEAHAGDPQKAIQRLIEAANDAGGKDNISIVLVEGDRYADGLRATSKGATDTRPLSQQTQQPAKQQFGAAHVRVPLWRRVLALVPLLLLLGAAALVLLYPPVRDRVLTLIGDEETPAPPPVPVIRVGAGETDFLSISDALADARPGQTIEIAPGEYRETIELKDGVALVSRVPRAAVIRAPQGAAAGGAATAAITGREVSARLSGLRIVGDREAPLAVGIRLEGAQVEASEIEVIGTSEAGIELSGADRSAITTSYVHDNAGAGIVVSGSAATQLRQNLIARNGMKAPKRPGVEIRGQARPLLIENRIEANGAAGVWLPSPERTDEILQWNQFGRTSRSQRVRVAPAQLSAPAATPAVSAPAAGPGRRR